MKNYDAQPIITLHASVPTAASPDDVYRVLSDLSTHQVWAGEQAPSKLFRLLTVEAPGGQATVGTTFSSTGANAMSSTFHDRSVVVVADQGSRFGFDTESTLQRKHRPPWHVRFAHRYSIEPSNGGARVSYSCEVRPRNYVPYWLQPWMRPATRAMVPRSIAKNMRNLARMAAGAREGDAARR